MFFKNSYCGIGEDTIKRIKKMSITELNSAINVIEKDYSMYFHTEEEKEYWAVLKGLYEDQVSALINEYAVILKDLRERANLTQRQLAINLGTNQKTLSFWETGQNRPNKYYQEKIKLMHSVLLKINRPEKNNYSYSKNGFNGQEAL